MNSNCVDSWMIGMFSERKSPNCGDGLDVHARYTDVLLDVGKRLSQQSGGLSTD